MKFRSNKNKKLKFVTKEDKKTRKRNLFICCFVIFIILFATVSILYFLKTYDYDLSKAFGESSEDIQEEATTTTKPVDVKGSNIFLFAGSSGDQEELYFVSLIKADFDKMQFSVCCLPINSIVQLYGNNLTFESHLMSGGGKQLSEAVSKYANVKIDKYVVVGEKNFKTATRYLGNFSLDINEKISYNGGDFSLNLLKGKQTLTGDKLINYIRYQEKQSRLYLDEQAKIICDMIDQMLNQNNVEKGEDLFNILINIIDSDITIVDYTKKLPHLQSYVTSDKRQPSVIANVESFKK